MKMKFIKIFLGCTFILATLNTACTSDFESTNIDPNRIREIRPATLLNPIIYQVASHNMYRSWSYNNHLMQATLSFPSNVPGIQRYDLSDNIGASSWNAYYKWMKNTAESEKSAVEHQEPNYEAIAITLRVWMAANLTDLFGSIPYFEALKGNEQVLYPAFDSQEQIYDHLLTELERANSLYDSNLKMIYNPDLLFVNDVSKWQKFTNSLHLRLLLRISNRVEKGSIAKMLEILNNPIKYPIITSNEDEAALTITGITPNVSPWSRIQDFTLSLKMASFFIDNLNDFDDPRLPVFATNATVMEGKKKVNIGFKGIPSAFDGPDSQFEYEASNLNNKMAANPTKTAILTYAEILFIKAELAQKGFLSDAQMYYEKGVEAAMKFYDVEIPEAYFDNPKTAYNGTLEQVMLQKYYALYMNDYQQWFEYKRTGLPKLPKTTSMLNNGVMPSRFQYPLEIRAQNKEQYEKAVQQMGGDDINTKLWWQ